MSKAVQLFNAARYAEFQDAIDAVSVATRAASERQFCTLLNRLAEALLQLSDGDLEDAEKMMAAALRKLDDFLPRFREHLEAELPQAVTAMEEAGALRSNPITEMPEAFSGGIRPGDEHFAVLTGRRPVIESALCRAVEHLEGLEVRRGVAVRGLLTAAPVADGAPHVVGVVTEDGEELRADLVVDTAALDPVSVYSW